MSTIARIILTAVLGVSIFTAAPAAADDPYRAVCVQDTDGLWFAYVIETQADLDWIGDRRVESFPNSAVGCSAYGPQKSAPAIPGDPEPCTPVVREVEVVKYVDRIVETSSVQTVTDTQAVERLQRKVTRQQRVIERLRARLARR